MRYLIGFLLLTGFVFGGSDTVYVSQPKSVLTSTALFSSVSNSALTTYFVDCGVTGFKVWSIQLTFTTTGKIDVCKSANAGGGCSTDGDTTSGTAIDIDIDDTVLLGFNLGSYHPSEVTTGTVLDGTFIAERNCVRKDYWR